MEISATIEGQTPLDPDELEGLKFPHITTRGELNELELEAITNGMRWLNGLNSPDVLSVGFICKLHKKLLGEVWQWAGEFRTTEKTIGIDPAYIRVQLPELLENVRYWIEHETYSPKEIAARFHHGIVKIHLFPNGNGRHSRIIADALLTKVLGEKAIDWSNGHNLKESNTRRKEYIAALRDADGHDFVKLLEFVGVK